MLALQVELPLDRREVAGRHVHGGDNRLGKLAGSQPCFTLKSSVFCRTKVLTFLVSGMTITSTVAPEMTTSFQCTNASNRLSRLALDKRSQCQTDAILLPSDLVTHAMKRMSNGSFLSGLVYRTVSPSSAR